MVRKVNILSWGIDSWKNPKNWGKNIHQFLKILNTQVRGLLMVALR